MFENLSPVKIYSQEAAEKLAKAFSKVSLKEAKGDGTFQVIATTEGIDRDGEVILVSGWDFENFMKNPIMLWGHNYWEMEAIVGAVTNLEVKDKQVVVSGIFANTESGQLARQLYDDGILKAVSVGFIPKDRTGNTITKAELLEISFVSVPANPDALSLSKIFQMEKIIKTAVAEHETALAPKDQAFDQEMCMSNLKKWATVTDEQGNEKMDMTKYQQGFAWFDEADTENMEAYKLCHHDVMDGELMCVWQGVVAAMTALLADGNAGIPQDQIEAVYNHLAAHYEQFGETAPEMGQNNSEDSLNPDEQKAVNKEVAKLKKLIGDLSLIVAHYAPKSNENEQKAGRVLSSKNRTLIQSCVESMNESGRLLTELLDSTEPDKGTVIEMAKGVVIESQQLQKMVENVIKNAKLLNSNL